MEGKALIFKYLGGVDAVPICLDTKDPYRIILAVKWLQPSFGGVNLEDIEQPKCFRVLDMLRTDPEVRIPVWHDDQQGTATVILAGVINALKVVGKRMEDIRVALIGTGAANVATLRLLLASGVQFGSVVACDSKGILHPEREDIAQRKIEFVDKWRICQHSNTEGRRGGPAEAMRGADVCIALSKPGPGTILPEWVKGMAEDAIVFPCANPVPEIWPWEAKEGQQLAGLPWHLPGCAGRAGYDHHRRDGHCRCRGTGSLCRGARARRGTHLADHGRLGSLPTGSSGRRREGTGAGYGSPQPVS